MVSLPKEANKSEISHVHTLIFFPYLLFLSELSRAMAEFSSSSAEAETCSENLLAEFSTVVHEEDDKEKEELKRKNVCEDSSPLNEYRDRKKMRGRQFMESEVELSGDNDSRDEVDDCTQATDHAFYLRSLEKSPEYWRPRALPPITEDIFSQAVNEADSFCVSDSIVENDELHDTLDSKQRAEMEDRGRKSTNEQLIRENRLIREAISEAERLEATLQAILKAKNEARMRR